MSNWKSKLIVLTLSRALLIGTTFVAEQVESSKPSLTITKPILGGQP